VVRKPDTSPGTAAHERRNQIPQAPGLADRVGANAIGKIPLARMRWVRMAEGVMKAYYNEIDPHAAAWLRELIKAGHIADGDVDERSIEDVFPFDLDGYTQHHFFAGIGTWSYALRRAGWPDSRPVWTGSCPCQPFSQAGKGKGLNDERHLWPAFSRLISACRPPVIFGEQVASSLITGKQAPKEVHRLWERKARLGILADWMEEDASIALQGMSQQSSQVAPSDAKRLYCNSGIKIDGSGEITRIKQGPAFRFDGAMGSGGSGLWSLRGYRNCFRSDIEPGVEYAISGSDTGRGRIHHDEHASHSFWPQCGLRELGREQSDRDVECDYEAAKNEVRRATEETDRAINAQNGESWIDTLQTDLEAVGYAVGAVPFPSAGVGAPHIRDRLYWVADANSSGLVTGSEGRPPARHGQSDESDCCAGGVEHALQFRRQRREATAPGNDDDRQASERAQGEHGASVTGAHRIPEHGAGPTNGFWRAADWLLCRDGKWRPVEPGYEQMVDGSASSLGRVCASDIEKIEGEINAWSIRHQADAGEALRGVWGELSAKAICEREAGRFSGVRAPSVLLAFMRQLTVQGWRFADAMACSRTRASEIVLRVMRFDAEAARTPLQRELAGQLNGESSNPLRELSSLLAHHAETCWADACREKAGAASFPLAHGAAARVMRLRGYGNSINAVQAQAFVEAFMESHSTNTPQATRKELIL